MPIGAQRFGVVTGPRIAPRTIPRGAPLAGLSPQMATQPQVDVWDHFTVTPAELAGGHQISLDLAAGRLIVLEESNKKLFIGLDGPADENRYDLKHPGGGLLDFAIPDTLTINLAIGSDGGPTENVDLWLMGGKYLTRP